METAQHTPGPWKVGKRDTINARFSHPAGKDDYWATVAIVHPRKAAAPYGNCDPESRANARLIAAAPELLEALRSALAYTEAYYRELPDDGPGQDYLMTSVIEPARAALAKADAQ